MTREEGIALAWLRGVLDWKLRPHQQLLYGTLRDADALQLFIKCARRFGKTFTVLLWILEQAIRRPVIIRYAAPTEKALRKFVQPNLRTILGDCPGELRPRYISGDSLYVWPNGSELHLAGTDKEHAEKLRGPKTDIAVADEAGTMDRLRYVLNDILLPSTLDAEPRGRMVVISTPPPTPDHDFTLMAAEAQANGGLFIQTVEQNTWLLNRPGLLDRYAEAMGGRESTAWRREMLCQDVVDETLAIIPEWSNPGVEERIVKEQKRPPYWQAYEAMDPGFSPSNTGVLFGYYDFLAGRLVIEDELELSRMRTDLLAAGIRAKEAELGYAEVPHRWSDIEPLLLADLQALHGMSFAATAKDLLEVMVNKVRLWVKQDRLRVHPRCKSLLAQLRVGVFNTQHTEFAYSPRFGHYDLLAALTYMVRNCPENVNPYPSIPDGIASDTHFIPSDMFKKRGNEALVEHLFSLRRRKVN